MALINLPDLRIKVRRLDLDVPGQVNRSDWTSDAQFVGLPGAEVWFSKVAFIPAATEADARKLRAFLLALKGQGNWCRIPVAPQQHAGPNPTATAYVNANQMGLSSTAGLVAGMFATFITGTKRRLVGLTADPAGGVVTFEPALRVAPGFGSAVEIVNPYVEARLGQPRNGWDDDDGLVSVEFDAEEL